MNRVADYAPEDARRTIAMFQHVFVVRPQPECTRVPLLLRTSSARPWFDRMLARYARGQRAPRS